MIEPKRMDFDEHVKPKSLIGWLFMISVVVLTFAEYLCYKYLGSGPAIPAALMSFERRKLTDEEVSKLAPEERETINKSKEAKKNTRGHPVIASFDFMIHPSFNDAMLKDKQLRHGFAEVLISCLQSLSHMDQADRYREQFTDSSSS